MRVLIRVIAIILLSSILLAGCVSNEKGSQNNNGGVSTT